MSQIAALAHETAPAAEFERARDELLGNLLIGTQANASRAARAARARIYGRPPEDLELLVEVLGACTPAQVQAAAAALVLPEARFEVLLGP